MVELARRPPEAVAQPRDEASSAPAPLRPLRARSRKGQRSPWWTVAVVAVVLLVAAAITWEVTQSGGPQYRLVSVTTGSVSQTLDEVGTVTPSNQADLEFGASGTVQNVGVSVGQTVTAGQTLATLDAAPLWAAWASAAATATSAAAKLTADENSETGSATSTTASSSGSGSGATATDTSDTVAATSDTDTANVAGFGTEDSLVAPVQVTEAAFPSSGGGTSPSGGSSSSSSKVQQAQAQLLAAQQKADTDQQQAAADLTTAIAACESTTTSGSSASSGVGTDASSAPATTPDSDPGGPGSGGSGSNPSGSGSGSGGSASNAACTQALAQLQKDEATVTTDLQTVSADETALSTALSEQASAATTTTTPTTKPTTKPTTSGGSHAGPSAASTAVVASPQQLAADQLAVDADNLAVSYAEQDVHDASLVSPISGTVASISVQPGSAVSPANGTPSASDAAIVVLGPGSFVVSTSVDVSDVPSVTVGQAAVVTPDSTNDPLQGKVTSIGLVGTSSDGSTSYPVTIDLNSSNGLQLTSGAEAEVAFVTKHVTNVTTVPSSAVRTIGTIHLLTRYENGKASTVRVTVGVVGDLLTQIQSGVSPGQKIVLADLNEALPGSNTSSTGTTGRTLGGGGFGGASGLGGGGFGGAGGLGGGGFGGGGFSGGAVGAKG
ncbi:MAG: HlyD family efflux transporter periplasmic adaptor subunit [Acidimicrobiales bacterium]